MLQYQNESAVTFIFSFVQVVLSLSSVLRGCLAVVDVRVSRDITIFIDYDHEVVEAFLTFLYKGFLLYHVYFYQTMF